MSLDIYLDSQAPHSKSISFWADGYYFFLYPLFKDLARYTGQMIDLYADATFEGKSLVTLKAILEKATQTVTPTQSDEWDVVTGWTDQARTTPIHDRVNRIKFLKLLGDFSRLVDTAIKTGGIVKCVGD